VVNDNTDFPDIKIKLTSEGFYRKGNNLG